MLLFIASVINYVDRQTLSILARTIQNDLHISDIGYARIVEIFLFGYMLAFLLAGWLTDKLGVRRSMTLFMGWWSLSDALSGFARSLGFLATSRLALGAGEAGMYTVSPKVASEWFPPKERGLAVGVCTAGATIGATIAPPLLAALTLRYGWRTAFWATAAAGLLWCAPWLLVYPRLSPAPFQSSPSRNRPAASLRRLLLQRNVLLLLAARILTDPVFAFILFWFPKYMTDVRHLSLGAIGHLIWPVYLACDVGSIAGGWISGLLIRRKIQPARARQIVMTASAGLLPLSALVPFVPSSMLVIAVVAIVALGHTAWMVLTQTLAVDIFPEEHIGTIFGFISTGNGIGGIFATSLIGRVVTNISYTPIFLTMGVLHPLALLLVWSVRSPRTPSSVVLQESTRESAL